MKTAITNNFRFFAHEKSKGFYFSIIYREVTFITSYLPKRLSFCNRLPTKIFSKYPKR